jgi:hypothetical protein
MRIKKLWWDLSHWSFYLYEAESELFVFKVELLGFLFGHLVGIAREVDGVDEFDEDFKQVHDCRPSVTC